MHSYVARRRDVPSAFVPLTSSDLEEIIDVKVDFFTTEAGDIDDHCASDAPSVSVPFFCIGSDLTDSDRGETIDVQAH